MPIHHTKNISFVYYGNIAISAVYRGAVLIYNAVRSCFGSGMWMGEKPWIGTDAWNSNK
jgi:hypothetical protein